MCSSGAGAHGDRARQGEPAPERPPHGAFSPDRAASKDSAAPPGGAAPLDSATPPGGAAPPGGAGPPARAAPRSPQQFGQLQPALLETLDLRLDLPQLRGDLREAHVIGLVVLGERRM